MVVVVVVVVGSRGGVHRVKRWGGGDKGWGGQEVVGIKGWGDGRWYGQGGGVMEGGMVKGVGWWGQGVGVVVGVKG